ncbi:MAG: TIGR01212 family radical SAM protein [Lachnospiraceae bacterium]|nr:TIGR01212 family radical SAM protein [Lachnospiraceae bacterium]
MTLLSEYLIETFGCKVYKVALNGGFTCPNRDGTIDTRGCIFCSAGGSGEFAEDAGLSITEQIEKGKRRVASKVKDGRYIAYFQAYTGTYAPIEKLKKLYTEAIMHPDVVAISIATRPDCISDEVLDLLSELNAIKPVWVELGLQTVHDRTAEYIRRGYGLDVYNKAVRDLYRRNIEVITHVILGLPGESVDDMLETVRYVCDLGREMTGRRKSKSVPEMKSGVNATPCQQMFGIKLQLLHVLKGTDLENEYNTGRFKVLTEDEYIEILKQCVRIIPNEVVIHRLTGDGDKRILIAPLWSGDKKHVWNRIQREVFAEKI